MNELIKIKEISDKYDITARTLRYYEDMGLIISTRSGDYAYRMYDEKAIKRLEQILILRKLNISIRDIQRIFSTSGSEVVLEVLGKKVDDIDDEVALLHELKDIVLEFIRQINQADFSKDSDVKLLYEKAKEIETQIVNVDYNGNPANVNRLIEVTKNLKKPPEVRIIELPKFRAVTSGYRTFDEIFGENGFGAWWGKNRPFIRDLLYASPDFMWGENGKTVWIWAINDWVKETDTDPYEIIEFEGGLYAAAISIDGDDDINGRVYEGIKKWIETSGFELDERPGHQTLCHMPNPTEEIKKGLGYEQLDIFVPIKLKNVK